VTATYAVVTAAVVLLAATANGDTVRKADLNDGGVWVVKTDDGVIGRYLKSIDMLDSKLAPKGSVGARDLEVFQDGTSVLLHDRVAGKLSGVDVAQQRSTDGLSIGGEATVGFGGGTLAVLSSKGELRIAGVGPGFAADPSGVAEGAAPALKGLERGDLAVSPDGSVAVAAGRKVVVLSDGSKKTYDLREEATAVTLVGRTPVVLAGDTLLLPGSGKTVTLPDDVGGEPVLQHASAATSSVAVAGKHGLALVDLGNGQVSIVSRGWRSGAARPLQLGHCVYGAWTQDDGYARSCNGEQATGPAKGKLLYPGGDLVFRVNRGVVVLNNTKTGDVAPAGESVSFRKGLWFDQDQDQESTSARKEISRGTQKPPIPKPDSQGVRPGLSTVAHVLDNDIDPEQDLLFVRSVKDPGYPSLSVSVAPGGQGVLLRTQPGFSGTATVQYSVSDGQSDRSSQLTVSAVAPDQNSAPFLRTNAVPLTGLGAVVGGLLRIPVLADWRDKEGDPFAVATVQPKDQLVVDTDGSLLFSPSRAGLTPLTYTVSDGSAASKSQSIAVTVLPTTATAAISPIARPDAVQVVVGRPFPVRPLENDLPGADPVNPDAQLVLGGDVRAPSPHQATTDKDRGVVTITAARPGRFRLDYAASYGAAAPRHASIWVDAVASAAKDQHPVAVPDTAVVHGSRPVTVDVLDNDVDPRGGLLAVQDVEVQDRSGVTAVVVDGRSVRLTGNVAGKQTSVVTYTATNGVDTPVQGAVAVTLLPGDGANTAPIAVADMVVVRSGQVTSLPVLDNDYDPEGDALTLVGVDGVPAGMTAAVSGREVRLLARVVRKQTSLSLRYTVSDALNATRTGTVSVTIKPDGRNQPPQPKDLEGRLSSGDTFTVHVPVFGIDPDGDVSTVVSVPQAPMLGRIVAVTPDSLVYQSFPNAKGGTDTFRYQVRDPLKGTGEAIVRLAVVQAGALPGPQAVADKLTVRPGRTVNLDVTANDVLAPGSEPTVTLTSPPSGVTLGGRVVSIKAPARGKSTRVTYTVTDSSGQSDSAEVVVIGGSDKDNLAPVAQDDTAALDGSETSVTVDVVKNDVDPDGAQRDLAQHLFVRDGQSAKATSDHKVQVQVGDLPRVVAYSVADPDGATAVGLIRVPGRGSDIPHVLPGKRIVLDGARDVAKVVTLSDYVGGPKGANLRVTLPQYYAPAPRGAFTASWVSSTKLRLTASGSYQGPAALSLQVSDRSDLKDPKATVVTLTIPVQIGADSPVLRCPQAPVQVMAGAAERTIEAKALCHLWVDTPRKVGRVRLEQSTVKGVSGVVSSMSGDSGLRLKASSDARPDLSGQLKISVVGGTASSTLRFVVIPAPAPTLKPMTITGLFAGKPGKVDVSRYVVSPFGTDAVSIVKVSKPKDAEYDSTGAELTVTPAASVKRPLVFTVTVTDVKDRGRPDRLVEGTLSVQVLNKPEAPVGLKVVSEESKAVTLTWVAPADNGARIMRYHVVGGPKETVCSSAPCTVTGLTNGQAYAFSVQAENAVGTGMASPKVRGLPNAKPVQVTGVTVVPADRTLTVSWALPVGEGTPPIWYDVVLSEGGDGTGVARVVAPTRTKVFTPLTNGGAYKVKVRAHNDKGDGPWSVDVIERPYGHPAQPGRPTAQGAQAEAGNTTAIAVTWPATDGNGRDIAQYTVTEYVADTSGGAPAATGQTKVGSPGDFGGGSQLATTFVVSNDGRFYSYRVVAKNAGDNASLNTSDESAASPEVEGAGLPETINPVNAQDAPAATGPGYNGAVHVFFTMPAHHAKTNTRIEWQVNGSGQVNGSASHTEAAGASIEQSVPATNGSSTQVQVRACNNAGNCGSWSNPSNTVVPYGPPGAPNVSASMSGNTVNYSWNGGGGNGRSIDHYYVCITGQGCSNRAAGSASQGYGYSTDWSISVYAVDTEGQNSGTVTRSGRTADAPPPASVTVSWGDPASSSICGGDTSCTYVTISWANFSSGNHTITPYYDGQGNWCGSACSNSLVRAGSSGTLTGYWAAGSCSSNHYVTATVDGVGSNQINTNDHPC
jgi:hypothetical protein